jgi:hypothetical protein
MPFLCELKLNASLDSVGLRFASPNLQCINGFSVNGFRNFVRQPGELVLVNQKLL